MKTKTTQFGLFVVFGLLTLVAGSTSAQQIVQFDEYGVGTLNGNPLPFYIAPSPFAIDPISGLSTLTYQLPFPVRDGDLFLNEGTTTPPISSDLVRFGNNSIGGVIYFFSDPLDPSDIGVPLADNPFGVPPPNAVGFPVLFANETGIEGSNGYVYTPNPNLGDPGMFPGALVTYSILSDGQVPEPSTFVLLGMGVVGLSAYTCRKRRSARILNAD
jgi:hypothetical protein